MKYEIVAVKASQLQTISLEADSDDMAMSLAKSQGYQVLSIKPIANFFSRLFRSMPTFQLTLFSQELLALNEAGLSIIESIEVLSEKNNHQHSKKILTTLLSHLKEGKSIATALALIPEAFTPLYIATLKAGEKTGGISQALKRYIHYQQQVDVIKKKVISASIYPAVLFIVGSLVILFLMGYVVPKFSQVYDDVSTLPFLSQMMMLWGKSIDQHFTEFLAIIITIVAGLVYLLRQPKIQASLFKLVCKLPTIGENIHIYQLSRFYRALGMLLTAGIPVTQALNMVSDLLSPQLKVKLAEASLDIQAGQLISAAMEKQGLTTSVSSRMLRVGEKSGQMGELMEKIAAFYDEEVARWMDWFTKLFEPMLMLVMGGIIGVVVLMLYMPIFDLVGNL